MHPAFDVLQPWIAALGNPLALPDLAQLNAWRTGGQPRFASPTTDSLAYELKIARDNEVPTRADNWHDAFNALCWLAWPRTKRAINQAHCAILAQGGEAELRRRSPARDVLTLLDEAGAVVLCSCPDLLAALRAGDWKKLFVDDRDALREHARVLVLGHALLDHVREGQLNTTAKCLLFTVDAEQIGRSAGELLALADGLACERLAQVHDLGRGRQYPPLPLMGWPGWHPDNQDHRFYLDHPEIFRARNPEALAQTR